MANVMQQVGGALGLAILVTLYGQASRAAASHPLATATAAAQAQHVKVQGMAASFTAAAIFDAIALLVIAAAIRLRQPSAAAPRSSAAAPSPAAAPAPAAAPVPAMPRPGKSVETALTSDPSFRRAEDSQGYFAADLPRVGVLP